VHRIKQQEGYRFLVETRGAAGGPSKIWVHNPKLVKASASLGARRPSEVIAAVRLLPIVKSMNELLEPGKR